MTEIALVSSRRTKLTERAKKGSKGAAIALQLLEEPEQLLSTVQIGITLIGIISGMFGGVALAEKLSPFIQQINALAPYSYEVSLGLVVSIITYLSLVVGELVPKTLGMTNPEGLAIMFAPALRVLSVFMRPISIFLGFSTQLILRLLGIKEKKDAPVSEEEMKMIIEQGVQHGVIEEEENEMIKSIFRFADRKAYSIMTNRRDIFWIDINEPFAQIRAQILENNYTKIPVCDESLDNVLGILLTKNFVSRLLHEPEFDIRELLLDTVVVPEATRAIRILEVFKEKKSYIGIIVDEYGVTIGIITLHDLIENIFGDLPQLDDMPEDELIVQREDGSYLIDGSMQTDELFETIPLPAFEASNVDYTTLAGFVIHSLKKVPHVGESFTASGYRFEVIDMDFNRIDKILVSKDDE